jgi:hypothetical protein
MSDYSIEKNDLKCDSAKAKWNTPEITELDYSQTSSDVFVGGDGVAGANS